MYRDQTFISEKSCAQDLSARQTTRNFQHRLPSARHCKDHMQDYLALSKVIEDIYDAVLDSARWTGVLAKITDFVDGQAGGLLSKDSVSKSGNAYHHFGVDSHYLALYAETCA
jgi:hypothetical protein